METVRILIVDDHPMFRKGLRALLASEQDFEVAGEATTGDEAIEMAETTSPDLILLDLQMPGKSGFDVAREIRASSPHIHILVVTLFQDDESIFAALRAGARGYLLKDANEEEMLRAIRAAASGEAIFSPGVASRMIGFFASSRQELPQDIFSDLTVREREILELIARGEANASIAEHLVLSPKTVRNLVSNIYSKLQVVDRAQAVVRARDAGMGRDRR
jgi:DNA-binding NarL/FixJ family response regulator